MASSLIADLHGQSLRLISSKLQVHFSGLRAAASDCRRRRLLPSRMIKQLSRLDDAYTVVRHITGVSSASFLAELDVTLSQVAPHSASSLPSCATLPTSTSTGSIDGHDSSVTPSAGTLSGADPDKLNVVSSDCEQSHGSISSEDDSRPQLAVPDAPPSQQATTLMFDIFDVQVHTETQTDLSASNTIIAADPIQLVEIATQNACCSLAAFVRERLASLGPALVDAPRVALPPPLPDIVIRDVPFDVEAHLACRRCMARLLVAWNHFAVEVRATAEIATDLDFPFLGVVRDGLFDLTVLSSAADSSLMVDTIYLADHLAAQVSCVNADWMAHLATALNVLLDWNLPMHGGRVSILSYIIAKFFRSGDGPD